MWPGTRGWTEKVQVPQLVNRRLPASPQVTSLSFTRQQHSLPPLVDWMMILNTLKVPHLMRTVTPRRLNLLPRKMRVCTYPVTLRRLYRTILFCRSRWPVPCESRRSTLGGASPVIGPATSHGIIKNGKKKMGPGPSSRKGPTLNKAASEKVKQKPSQPGWPGSPMEYRKYPT